MPGPRHDLRWKVRRMARSDLTISDLARLARAPYRTVYGWVQEDGLPYASGASQRGRPSPLWKSPELRAAFLAAIQQPLADANALGLHFGVTPHTARKWARWLGHALPHGRGGYTQRRRVAKAAGPELYRCVCGGLSTDKSSVDHCTHQQEVA